MNGWHEARDAVQALEWVLWLLGGFMLLVVMLDAVAVIQIGGET